MSLCQLSAWCRDRFGEHVVAAEAAPRQNDVPWLVLDSRLAEAAWGWRPTRTTTQILEEIAQHAESHPDWLETSAPV